MRRVGDGRADHSHKHRRHGVNVQVVTDPGGRRPVEGLGNGVLGAGPCQDSQGRLTMRTVYAEETQRLVPTLRKPLVVDADARIVEPLA